MRDDRGRKLRLFFENRASTSYGALQNYMQWIQNDPDCTIRRDCIVSYQPVEATRKLAQVADFYASATAAALEPDQYGMPTEDYLMRVKHSSIASQARASRATASRCSQTSIRPAIRAVASL